MTSVGCQEGALKASVWGWLARADIDDDVTSSGITSEECAKIKRLTSEGRRLREDNAILRKASIFFGSAPSSSRPSTRVST
ncbi:hypothetical protein [Brachybacterium sacelli]|uniref:Transposase-like protein n=1 Tax=Brachybacterium sacelli TaxID=173364 RepID=A0ABS4X378_9MICO|nr:hypothetical protein [Brachybacterium sacelli]MBP2382816.1 transposase-like protein [Brachybacterium sacelli]